MIIAWTFWTDHLDSVCLQSRYKYNVFLAAYAAQFQQQFQQLIFWNSEWCFEHRLILNIAYETS